MDLKKMLCINEEDDILIYQGKFHEGRGIRFVIQCITKLKNIALVLIGDGPMKIKYLETAKKYNMEDKLFFIDAVPGIFQSPTCHQHGVTNGFHLETASILSRKEIVFRISLNGLGRFQG